MTSISLVTVESGTPALWEQCLQDLGFRSSRVGDGTAWQHGTARIFILGGRGRLGQATVSDLQFRVPEGQVPVLRHAFAQAGAEVPGAPLSKVREADEWSDEAYLAQVGTVFVPGAGMRHTLLSTGDHLTADDGRGMAIDHVVLAVQPGALDSVSGLYAQALGMPAQALGNGKGGLLARALQRPADGAAAAWSLVLAAPAGRGTPAGNLTREFLTRHGPGVLHVCFRLPALPRSLTAAGGDMPGGILRRAFFRPSPSSLLSLGLVQRSGGAHRVSYGNLTAMCQALDRRGGRAGRVMEIADLLLISGHATSRRRQPSPGTRGCPDHHETEPAMASLSQWSPLASAVHACLSLRSRPRVVHRRDRVLLAGPVAEPLRRSLRSTVRSRLTCRAPRPSRARPITDHGPPRPAAAGSARPGGQLGGQGGRLPAREVNAIRIRVTGGVCFVHRAHAATLSALRELIARFGAGSHTLHILDLPGIPCLSPG